MARISTALISNADAAKESTVLAQKGVPVYINTAQPATDNSGKTREGVTGPLLSRPYPPQYYGDYVALEEEPIEDWPVDGPVSVSEQKAAGVPAEDTVTLSEQEGGLPPPVPPAYEGNEEPSAGTSSSASEKKPGKSGSSAQGTESSRPSHAPDAESHSSQDQASSPAPSSTAPSTSGSTHETGTSQHDPSNSSEGQQTGPVSETEVTVPLSGRDLVHAARDAYEAKDWSTARELLEAAREVDPSMKDEVAVAMRAVQTASESTPSAGGFLIK